MEIYWVINRSVNKRADTLLSSSIQLEDRSCLLPESYRRKMDGEREGVGGEREGYRRERGR